MKNSRSLLLSRPFVIGALLIGFSLVAGTALLSAATTRAVETSGARVGHARSTLLQINQLLASLLDAETGQRGYILTGLEQYLDPYNLAKARLDRQLDALRENFAGSPGQTAALAHIRTLATQKFAEIDRTIALRRRSIGAALNVVGTGEGLVTMNALREEIHALELGEIAELNAGTTLSARHARQAQAISLAFITLAAVLTLAGARLLMLRVRELEDLITVCAWTNRVKYEGKWVSFEQYLRQRFNLRFTHGISEEATRKLMMEEVELHAHAPAGAPPPFSTPGRSVTRA